MISDFSLPSRRFYFRRILFPSALLIHLELLTRKSYIFLQKSSSELIFSCFLLIIRIADPSVLVISHPATMTENGMMMMTIGLLMTEAF